MHSFIFMLMTVIYRHALRATQLLAHLQNVFIGVQQQLCQLQLVQNTFFFYQFKISKVETVASVGQRSGLEHIYS